MIFGHIQRQAVWGIAVDTSSKRVALLGLLSLVVHLLVLSPLGALLGLLSHNAPQEDAPLMAPITEIPVSLLDDEADEDQRQPAAPAVKPAEPAPPSEGTPAIVPPSAPAIVPKKKVPTKVKPLVDAGAPAAVKAKKPKKSSLADAGVKPKRKKKPIADAGVPREPRIADPGKMVSNAAQIADTNANVKLSIYTKRIRGHLLGQRIGALFAALPQWQSFLGGGGIDMVRDVDVVVLLGPQFRRSDQVVAFLGYNAPQARMKAAIDGIVKRDPHGQWLDTPFPAAIAEADRAPRLFALPKASLAIVSPLSAQQSVLKTGPTISMSEPKGEEAVDAYVKTPWRVLLGTNVSLPQSIKWARLKATPIGKGDLQLEIEAGDASAQAATDDARAVSQTINQAAQLGGIGAFLSGFGFTPLLDHVELQANGKKITGSLHVSAEQLTRILAFVEDWAAMATGRTRAAPAVPTPTGGGKPTPSTGGSVVVPKPAPSKPTTPSAPEATPVAPAPSAPAPQ
ncbi:MAG TPA: hypothetical protein VL137_01010 [Polyangiaceae bacterium]|nr:hypothetical protein [Polyangiaceae bacterium]